MIGQIVVEVGCLIGGWSFWMENEAERRKRKREKDHVIDTLVWMVSSKLKNDRYFFKYLWSEQKGYLNYPVSYMQNQLQSIILLLDKQTALETQEPINSKRLQSDSAYDRHNMQELSASFNSA